MDGLKWFYSLNGQPTGPVPFESLRRLAAEGRLAASDLVWMEGTPEWVAASTVPGLIPAAPPLTYASPPPPPHVPGPGVRDPYYNLSAAPYQGGYGHGPGTVAYRGGANAGQSQQGMAVAGFVLSLTIPLLGLIFSWIALSGMKSSGNEEGKGLATAGLVISIVFVSIGCLWVIGVMSCFGAAFRGW